MIIQSWKNYINNKPLHPETEYVFFLPIFPPEYNPTWRRCSFNSSCIHLYIKCYNFASILKPTSGPNISYPSKLGSPGLNIVFIPSRYSVSEVHLSCQRLTISSGRCDLERKVSSRTVKVISKQILCNGSEEWACQSNFLGMFREIGRTHPINNYIFFFFLVFSTFW